MTTLQILLNKLNACPDAQAWIGKRGMKTAWQKCERGDWLLWIAGRLDVDRKLLVRAVCACARLALPYVTKGELRPLKAIETAEAWCDDKATIEKARTAASASYAAASAAAYAAASAAASYAAASAAAAASASSSYAASSASYASYAAASAAASYAAASAAVNGKTLATCANIVRKIIPFAEVTRAKKARGR